MKISVIMPIYNCEKYLDSAISSVLSQKGVELEIIAIDDGSVDTSADILARLAASDSRIKPYFTEKNRGVAFTRNLALKYATGDYLAFCDADDIVPEGAYAALLKTIGNNDVAIGAYDALCDDGSFLGLCPVKADEKKSLFKSVISSKTLWTKLIRREFVVDNELTFDAEMSIGEDVVFLANLVLKNPTYAVTDIPVYYHCHHETSVSRSLTHTYTLSAFQMHIKCRRAVASLCADIPGAKDYVYVNFTSFISSFITMISPDTDRRIAFELYKEYLEEYDFSNNKPLFCALCGVPYDNFSSMTVDEFIEIRRLTPARDSVLLEFEHGLLGLRWIIKYFKAWLRYKTKKS